MDHGGMDHGDMGSMCSMNMLFTWNTKNLCVVFEGWRVTGVWSLIYTILAVIALTAGYEAVREASRRFELQHARKIEGLHHSSGSIPTPNERSSLLGLAGNSVAAEEKKGKTIKAVLYGVQVFYSFFIMLLFMTYNGWIMIAVGVGATIGYMLFSESSATKSAACH
ncbi:uncharacterized protein MYCFIDRAFT_34933 [Pseudocercospora fijiensis CIRAD86]|uniref:Copper transport protein n=1 Tax=Pseudocercospora fijiensis (strain CIRAD86) TaxID=383855 RepID=M2ZJZ3_PSEFD|nr:uncharacterized protein MYCFIDRAFT_34933 [Pseudocercospora fijiensis CIRAD86]EME79429.1 hypothetical protein MYCFIDRAFT_34933 [Pseudocercospora fijiensis CIRAD86]